MEHWDMVAIKQCIYPDNKDSSSLPLCLYSYQDSNSGSGLMPVRSPTRPIEIIISIQPNLIEGSPLPHASEPMKVKKVEKLHQN